MRPRGPRLCACFGPARGRSVALLVLAASLTSACSVSEFLTFSPPEQVAGPQPAHRRIVALGIESVVADPARLGPMQISEVRRVSSLKGESWLACLKTERQPLPQYFAVFIQRNRIVDSRVSVLIDQCELQAYTPFDWAADAAAPAAQ